MARAAPGRILAGLEHHGRPDRQEDHDHHRYESDVEQSRSAHAVPPLLASWPACCGYSSPESGVAAMKPSWWRYGARRVMACLDREGNVKATWKAASFPGHRAASWPTRVRVKPERLAASAGLQARLSF